MCVWGGGAQILIEYLLLRAKLHFLITENHKELLTVWVKFVDSNYIRIRN